MVTFEVRSVLVVVFSLVNSVMSLTHFFMCTILCKLFICTVYVCACACLCSRWMVSDDNSQEAVIGSPPLSIQIRAAPNIQPGPLLCHCVLLCVVLPIFRIVHRFAWP